MGTPAVTFIISGCGVNRMSLNGETLLGDDELREKYRENARKRVMENFTIPKMVEKQEECYREIEC